MTKYLVAIASASASATLLAAACGSDMPAKMMIEPPPPDTTVRTIDADDANIQYTGRVDFTNPKLPKFSANGVVVAARFKGTAVSALIKDEHRYGKYSNAYDAIVDGMDVLKIVPDANNDSALYPIVSGLPYGEHDVMIVRRTEPTVGYGYFVGFQIAGVILPPPDRPAHRIEVIGDSITAGAGIDAVNNDPACTAAPDGWGLGVEDVYKAYGPVLAQSLAAEYHMVGVSGIGLVRDYSSDPANDLRAMPQVYDLLFPQLTTSTSWDPTHTKWVPDALVIGLGTNDFSPGDNPASSPRPIIDKATFVAAYTAFIDTLRGYYPAAQIFIISSPLLADGWPDATYRSASDLNGSLAIIEDHYITAGDLKVKKAMVSHVTGTGCGTHPDALQQAMAAMELAPVVKTAMGW
jgi:lysophospholipase L1-like esterase